MSTPLSSAPVAASQGLFTLSKPGVPLVLAVDIPPELAKLIEVAKFSPG